MIWGCGVAKRKRLEASEALNEAYRDALADMHEGVCAFDDPPPKPNDVSCMACYAFQVTDPLYQAHRKTLGKEKP